MIETIKAVLENYKNANLESKSCREKIAEEIKKKLDLEYIYFHNLKIKVNSLFKVIK